MRASTSTLTVALTALVVGVSAVPQQQAMPNQIRELEAMPTPDLGRRQLGGGAGGTQPEIDSLQTISGYTPPLSTQIGVPDVPAGQIVATNSIPGFNSSGSSGSGAGGGISAAYSDVQSQSNQMVFVTVAGAAAAGMAYMLF
ncbi:unnamed protein product [Sympodiomycopsis kandeliae]